MKKTLFSVIMPVFNAELYLREAIDSVLNQSFKDFELIIINDGSTDNSENIIKSYSDERIRYYKQRNSGPSVARNFGIKKVNAEFILFLDSDDTISKNLLLESYRIINERQIDLIIFGYTRKNTTEINQLKESISFHEINRRNAFENIIKNSYKNVSFVTVWGKVIRYKLVSEMFFPTNTPIYEDVFYTNELYFKVKNIYLCENPLYFYRKNTNSLTQSSFNLSKKIHGIEGKIQRIEIILKKNYDHLLIPAHFSLVMYFNLDVFRNYPVMRFQKEYPNLFYTYKLSLNYLMKSNISILKKFTLKIILISPFFFGFLVEKLFKLRKMMSN